MTGEISSEWLKNYIRKFGGVMNIAHRQFMEG